MTKEWDHAATVELRAHPHPPTCLFKDIAGFLKSHLRCVLSDLQSTDRFTTDLEPLIETDKAVKTYLGHESSLEMLFFVLGIVYCMSMSLSCFMICKLAQSMIETNNQPESCGS